MKASRFYGLHNEKLIPKYIRPNSLCKGYSLHIWQMNEIWTNIMNILIECIEKKAGVVSIVNTLPAYCSAKELSTFYGDYFYRIKDRIPSFTGNDNEKYYLITDKLPFAAKFLMENDLSTLLTTYTVVRPRSFALKPFLREEFIRYFQLIVSSKIKEKQEFIIRIESALSEFFNRINLQVVLADRPSESYYKSKSCYYAIWPNGRAVSILQCGLLRDEIAKTIISNDDVFILDIGGAQRLLASWLYANSDIYGAIWPEEFRSYDIMMAIKERTDYNNQVIDIFEKNGLRVLVDDSLGMKRMSQIRNKAYSDSVLSLLVQRVQNGKEFYIAHFRNGLSMKIDTVTEMNELMSMLTANIKTEGIESQKKILNSHIMNGYLLPSTNDKRLTIISRGLFKDKV